MLLGNKKKLNIKLKFDTGRQYSDKMMYMKFVLIHVEDG